MKAAILQILDCVIVEIMKGLSKSYNGIYRITENGLPTDAVVISYEQKKDGTIEILLKSETFKDIKDGNYPILESPVLTSLNIELS